jgi:hypothetical protein
MSLKMDSGGPTNLSLAARETRVSIIKKKLREQHRG